MSQSTGDAPPLIRPRRLRADRPLGLPEVEPARVVPVVALLIVAGFTLIGGGNLDLGPREARLGLAAGEAIGPYGNLYGAWAPDLLLGRVLPSRIWALNYGAAVATTAAVRWPEAIAMGLIGLLAAGRLGRLLGPRAAIVGAFVLGGSIALINRSAEGLGALDAALGWLLHGLTGSPSLLLRPIRPDVNPIAGLCAVLALDRLIRGRTDAIVGLLAGLGFLAGGWPVLAVVALPTVVLGRGEGARSGRAVLVAGAVVVAWSAWALATAPVDVWAATLALPLTAGPAWTLAPWAVVYALPWSPMAALIGFRTVRDGLGDEGHRDVLGWLKAAGALAIAGTIVPGLGDAARLPLLFGLAMAAAAGIDRLVGSSSSCSTAARRTFWGLAIAGTIGWAAVSTPLFGYVAAAVGAYRPAAVLLVGLGLLAPIVAGFGLAWSRPAVGFGALVIVAVALKLAHWGVIEPEWDYRVSQGPWGRAIGQWMPRRATLYFVNTSAYNATIARRDRWPADLAFAVGRRVREIPAAESLNYEPADENPHYVLLHPSEFEHWPSSAPPLVHVRDLQDRFGEPRVLARTEGEVYPDRREELGE